MNSPGTQARVGTSTNGLVSKVPDDSNTLARRGSANVGVTSTANALPEEEPKIQVPLENLHEMVPTIRPAAGTATGIVDPATAIDAILLGSDEGATVCSVSDDVESDTNSC
jgi:hypothetical protein